MSNKKKILFFLQSGVGGAERITITIAKYLDKEEYDIKFVLLYKNENSQPIREFIPNKYSIIAIKNKGGLYLLYDLLSIVKKEKPDIIFSSMMYINTRLLISKIFLKKIKFIIRNNNYLYTLTKSQKIQLYLTYKNADVIIAQTEEMRNELVGLGLNDNQVVTLQNPIDTDTIDLKSKEKAPFSKHGRVVYVSSGRFNYVKGYDVLIDAFSMVIEKEPNSILYIIGKNTENCQEYFQDIQKHVQKNKVDEKVHFVGFQNNPYKYVKNADCFVLSSRNEGLPNVLIEALYLGTPVAATTCIPIISRIVNEGVNGFLAEVENPKSLANAMIQSSKLGRVVSSYQSASKEEFLSLFERL